MIKQIYRNVNSKMNARTIDIPLNLLLKLTMGVKNNYILFFDVDVTYV